MDVYVFRYLTLLHNSSSKGAIFQVSADGILIVANVTVKGSSIAPTSYTYHDFALVGGGFDYLL
jgi:hypothetical protein